MDSLFTNHMVSAFDNEEGPFFKPRSRGLPAGLIDRAFYARVPAQEIQSPF
jgi:hypothetical protein